ncbi:MAG TPA: hypothetical protein VE130_08800 [Nitrososphaeraceae archaeon]|jgi:hypothetical protein|nr:hypothetical protein [Nitrososphaeraceae archaeon]
MTEFSSDVLRCIEKWSAEACKCNNNTDCINERTQQLRVCLDRIFPPSKSIEFESDKVNYLLSSVFFLANRLAKCTIGLSELDRAIGNIEKIGKVSIEKDENTELYDKFQQRLDEILKEYF